MGSLIFKCFKCLWLACIPLIAGTAFANPDRLAGLRAKYTSLEPQLRQNQFKRPMVLESVESGDRLRGDVYAVIDYPFDAVKVGLNNPDHWCDVILLHVNTKYCHASVGPAGTNLRVNIGRKPVQDLTTAPALDFNYRAAVATPQYFETLLTAQEGPMGTSNYQIILEALALPGNTTFMHLTYAYSMNLPGRLALRAYLGTLGSDKAGFTEIGTLANGQPELIGGMRGMVERNTMRYYLAIDSFLASTSAAPTAQLEQRLQRWYTASEGYSRQLHDVDRTTYLEMKRAENLRQQSVY